MLKLLLACLATGLLSVSAAAHNAYAHTGRVEKKKSAIRKKAVSSSNGRSKKKHSKSVARKKLTPVKSSRKTVSAKAKKRLVMDPFTRNMGSLHWPMEEGTIKTAFGPYKVGLGAVLGNNPGLTLEAAKDSEVKSAFEGTVTLLFEIEGKKAVVIKHGNYLTVYGNLSLVNVAKDDVIGAGDIIGRAASNEEGNAELEFLLMRKNQNIDPEPWMKRK